MVLINKSITKSIIQAVKKNIPFPHYRVFYFGSRASGTAQPRSDYDVGIEASQKIPLYTMSNIKGELEEIRILQKIDFVDFKSVPKTFAALAKKDARVIYEQ